MLRSIIVIATMVVGMVAVYSLVTALKAGLQPARTAYLPACQYEDSDNCIWDAKRSGNGQGTSFVVYEGKVYYEEIRTN